MKKSTEPNLLSQELPHTQSTIDSTTTCDTVDDMNERDLEKKVRELEMECIEAKVRYNELMRAFQAAQELLDYEKRKAGKTVSRPSKDLESASKTAAVLRIIEDAGGATSAEVLKAVNESGVKMSRQHVYNTLNRLCSEQRIERRGMTFHSKIKIVK